MADQDKPQPVSLSENEIEKFRQYVDSNVDKLGLNETYTDILRSIFSPMYARKPVLAPHEFDAFSNPQWAVYERETSVSADRLKRLKDYADMDSDTTIGAALDIYASEACQYSDEHNATIWCHSQDPTIMDEWQRLYNQINLEDYIEGIVRDTAKNGDDFISPLWNLRDGVVNLKFVEPDEVTIKTDRYGRLIGYRYQDSKTDLEPWIFTQYSNKGTKRSAKHGGSVYGTSLIEPARKTWRQLKMMEDSLAIWRMDIGTRRLAFYVDVGNLGQSEAMALVREWERAYKKRAMFNPQTGEFISRHSPLAADNHYFWPIRPNSKSRIEYIGGDANVSAVADVDYFRRKLAAALKIPMAYLGGDEYSSVRSGIAQLDVYFARMVKKLQRAAIRGTTKLFFTHLRIRNIPYSPSEVRILMEPVSSIEEMQRLEVLQAAVQLAAMMFQTLMAMGIPPEFCAPYILKEILKMSESDLSTMKIDAAQVQAMQQQTNDLSPEVKQEAQTAITEALQSRQFRGLKSYIEKHADDPDDQPVFIPEFEIPSRESLIKSKKRK